MKNESYDKPLETNVDEECSYLFSVASFSNQDKTKGNKWDVTVIKAGKTLTNPAYYIPIEALQSSLKVFDGAKVYANSLADANGHKTNRNEKVPSDVVGVLSKPYIAGDELRATFSILPSAQWLTNNLLMLAEENQLDVYQLSVDSSIVAKTSFVESLKETLPVVNRITRADVDIVGEAAAGGKINKLAASKSQINNSSKGNTMKQKMLSLLFFFPTLLAGKTMEDWNLVAENEMYSYLLQGSKGFFTPDSMPEGMTEANVDTLVAAYRDNYSTFQASQNKSQEKNKVLSSDNSAEIKALQASIDEQRKLTASIQKEQCATLLTARTATLPVPLRESLQKRFKDVLFSVNELETAILQGMELIKPFMTSQVNNYGMDVKITAEQIDKLQLAVDGMFLTSKNRLKPMQLGSDEAKSLNGITPFRSIKEAYINLTGDEGITGQASSKELRLSIVTADWANVISTAINKAMVRDYPMMNLDTWRAFADVVPLNDFKQQQRLRYGGYANLPTVSERGLYTPLTSPTDEKATYSPAKRGATEDITREMIKNDDVSAIQRIPTRMARAAAQTLHEFVYDFIKPSVNPTIYDSLALYHATHGNTGTAALDSAGLQAARLRMKKYAMKDNSKRLGIRAGYLIVPGDLEKTAYDLLTPAFNKNNAVPEFLQQIGVLPIVVDYWTDATDWVLAARREDVIGLEVGFIDGQETPQLFVSDMPNAGSFFTNDVMTFKIRHEYGGAIIDWRAFDGEIVAG